MPDFSKKGIILFIVIGVILVVVTLATVVLRVISSQSRLTHHSLSRIQAQYAAKAGMIYALERLRKGDWAYSPVNSCPSPGGCAVTDTSFPASTSVRVIFCPIDIACGSGSNLYTCKAPSGSTFCVNSLVDFTYTAPVYTP